MIEKHLARELDILRSQLEEGDTLILKEYIPLLYDIVSVFNKEGHSGFSAHQVAKLLAKTVENTLLLKPLSPITGYSTEWNDVGHNLGEQEKTVYQNNRLSSVFKHGIDGKPYYLDAIVWQGAEKYDTFTGQVEDVQSRQYVRLPFTPKTFYVDVVKEYYPSKPEESQSYYEENHEDGTKSYYYYRIKDRKQLEEVFTYYEEYKPETNKA